MDTTGSSGTKLMWSSEDKSPRDYFPTIRMLLGHRRVAQGVRPSVARLALLPTLVLVLFVAALLAMACGTGPDAEEDANATTADERITAAYDVPKTSTTAIQPVERDQEQGYVVKRGSVGDRRILFVKREPGPEPLWPTMSVAGELAVDAEGCIRLLPPGDMPGWLLLWPSDYEFRTGGGEVRIHDGDGRIVAKEGDEIGVSGGGSATERRGVSEECRRGQYWDIDEVSASLVTPQVVPVSENDTAIFLRHSRSLDDQELREGELSGELALADGDYERCLVVRSTGADYFVPLWPPSHYARARDGEVEALDGSGRIVARTGEQVRLGGGEIPEAGAPEEFERLPQTTGCPGPYWIVRGRE